MSDQANRDKFEPAFPVPGNAMAIGMSLRDWFAGMAMSGMMADTRLVCGQLERAIVAYDMADFMLAERSKQQCQTH